jgi:hypothetical protein
MGNPRTKDSPPPQCPRMLGCTANGASTHHFRMPLPLSLRISGIMRAPLMYLIKWTNLVQSSLSGAHTLVVKNTIAVQVSDLARLVAYTVFATRLLNSTSMSCLLYMFRCYLNRSWVIMRNVKIINLTLWIRNCILSFGSFHIHSWDIDIICDHCDHSWERVIVVFVGIHSWDFNIADEKSVYICECHLMGMIAA